MFITFHKPKAFIFYAFIKIDFPLNFCRLSKDNILCRCFASSPWVLTAPIKITMFRLENFRNIATSTAIVAIFISLFSCQQGKGSRPEDFGSYRLEKEKEFLIHSIPSVELLDYYPEDRLYLGYTITPGGNEITLVNEDGEIVLSRNMQGEGPGQHSSNLSCLGFSENGDIWAMTSVQVLRYDQNLKLLDNFFYMPNFMITLYSSLKKFSYFRKDTNRMEIAYPVIPSGVGRYRPEDYDTGRLLEIYDQRQGRSKEIVPISKRRITEEFLEMARGFYAPVHVLNAENAKLFLTGTFDNEITVYDLNADSVAGSIDIYHGDPNAVEPPATIGTHTLSSNPENWLLTSMNIGIHNLDDGMIALEYLMGVSVNPNPPVNLNSEIHPVISRNRFILFDQNRQLSGDLTIPEQGKVMTSLPGNRLLLKAVNPDVEEDFIRY